VSRIRTIKPEFFKHEGLFDLELSSGLPVRLAFAGLWTCCDREGRFKWRPRSLKSEILPFDDCDFSRVLDALATRGFLVKYALPEEKNEMFGFIPSWKSHQFVNNKEAQSDLPEPLEALWILDVDACGTREPRVSHANPNLALRKGKERKDYICPETSSPDQHNPPSVSLNGSLVLTSPELPAVPASHSRVKRASKAVTELDADVDECFSYFKKQLNKRASYKLDKKGRAMGIEGLKACAELAAEYGKEEPSRIAVEFLKEAINRMATDKFHNGENDRRTKYLDWEQLFGSKAKPAPRKLIEYWLDDNRVA
jgi:hypothetical protein